MPQSLLYKAHTFFRYPGTRTLHAYGFYCPYTLGSESFSVSVKGTSHKAKGQLAGSWSRSAQGRRQDTQGSEGVEYGLRRKGQSTISMSSKQDPWARKEWQRRQSRGWVSFLSPWVSSWLGQEPY